LYHQHERPCPASNGWAGVFVLREEAFVKRTKEHQQLRAVARELLRELEWVPFRAIDCDQDRVMHLLSKLKKLSGYRLIPS
jgi:hypothetical protein